MTCWEGGGGGRKGQCKHRVTAALTKPRVDLAHNLPHRVSCNQQACLCDDGAAVLDPLCRAIVVHSEGVCEEVVCNLSRLGGHLIDAPSAVPALITGRSSGRLLLTLTAHLAASGHSRSSRVMSGMRDFTKQRAGQRRKVWQRQCFITAVLHPLLTAETRVEGCWREPGTAGAAPASRCWLRGVLHPHTCQPRAWPCPFLSSRARDRQERWQAAIASQQVVHA